MSKVETFTQLHLHTTYSMLDGVGKAKDYAQRCAELGMQACAITDHGTMAGLFEFYTEMNKVRVKPILGNDM